ncbi:DUF7010 family protein [Ornithinimicrobium pratense]|uniref:Uncharacterized protein n=1 Tax=Ornithinimicrobium pratense TaxID=2593973 RepID=A0A5J6V2W8_9MICO|nr:hypothetical protein [Ornithinimicrobium pratense]QFG68038.1 hypothetical protein FY030_04270 [Ornithinimicrobium pratense]
MTDLGDYLSTLATVNRHGFGFLLAYGTTWLAAAALWWRLGPRVGAYAALFQGLVALPLGLTLTALFAAGERPDDPTMNALSIYLAMGQLLLLPLAVVLLVRQHFLLATAFQAVVVAVHFVPYSWLYGTPLFAVLGPVIAFAVTVVVAQQDRWAGETRTGRTPGALVCLSVGVSMALGGVIALLL